MVTSRALKSFLLAFLLLSGLFLPVRMAHAARAVRAQGGEILSHTITARLDISRHFLDATDQIKVGALRKNTNEKPFSFVLASSLKIVQITIEPGGRALSWSIENTSQGQLVSPMLPAGLKFPFSLKVHYQGEIYDPVQRAGSLGFLRGDQTRGIIGNEGVYLSPESGWYPDQTGSLARFDLDVEVPIPLRTISQGKLVSEEEKEGGRRALWQGEVPAEGLYLLVGNYVVSSRQTQGVELFTYFFPAESDQAPHFLAAAEEIIGFYSKLLGPYPYSRFSIVENFFSSGYGMPGFTLLGPQVIQMGDRALQPGYLDHEIVHSWWGNYVYPDMAHGNWSEGLTSYLTNYLAKEVNEGEQGAVAYRKGVVQKFSTRVSPMEEYAPEDFRDKRRDVDDDIGYGKISMMFHLLRRELGEGLFYQSLRTIVQTYRGKRTSWSDFEKVFSKVSKKNLKLFFKQWVTVSGSPSLSLDGIRLVPGKGKFLLQGMVRQEDPVFGLEVPVVIDFGGETKTLNVSSRQRITRFAVEVDRSPQRVLLDPEFHIFRRLPPSEVPPSLQAFLSSTARILVLPGAAPADRLKVYQELAARVADQKGARVLPDSAVTDEIIRDSSLFFLGDPAENRALENLLRQGNIPIQWEGAKIRVKGEEFHWEDTSLLASWRNPESPDRFVTVYAGGSEKALGRWPYLFFYGWDGYLVFSDGKPVRRGNLVDTATRGEVILSRLWGEKIRAEALVGHETFLAAAEMKGRLTGSPEGIKAAEYIRGQWKKQNLSPPGGMQGSYFQSFPIRLRDLARFRLTLRADGNQVKLHALTGVASL